jgi:iron complex outermembrane receptor protein
MASIGIGRAFKPGLLGGCALGVMAGVIAPSPVQAQETSAVSEIIVTAQRRAERLEDVPMSIAAVTADTIANSGVTSIHDLGQLAAGVKIEFAGGFSQPSIRGVTTLTTGSGFENNVAIYVDGFYSPDNVSINTDLANVADVQILKGPQGALYGRNATGGAILINTLAPSKTFTARADASYARFNEYTLGGYVSGPISDTARYSLAAYQRDSDGYVKYIDPAGTGRRFGHAAPFRQDSIRGKVEVDLTDNLTGTLALNYGLSADPRGLLFTIWRASPTSRPLPPFSASEPYTASTNSPTDDIAIVKEGTAKFAYKSPIGTLTSYTGFAHRNTKYDYDFDGSYAKLLSFGGFWKEDTFQQTLDYAIDAIDKLDLVVGGTYYDDRTHNDGSITISGTSIANVTYANLTAKAWAAYADGAYHLTDRLSLNAGARYTEEKKHIDYRQVNGTQSANIVPPGSGDKSFSAFTPRASIRYEVAPRTNVYASWSKGFRSGGFQPTPPTDPRLLIPFRPEKITAYEVGFKTAQSIFRFDVAAFYYDYKDLQVGLTIPNPIGIGVINQTSNAPKAEIYGMDAQGSASPVHGLTLRAGVSLLHARYRDFVNVSNIGLNPATGLNVTQLNGDWSGLQMARAPTVSGNLGADYETQVANGTLKLTATASYTSSFPLSNPSVWGPLLPSIARVQRYKSGEYTLVNAQVTWTDPSDHYTVGVFGTNLGNTKYLVTNNGTAVYGDYRGYGEPRSYGVKVGYKY